jgi:hypothetical protein
MHWRERERKRKEKGKKDSTPKDIERNKPTYFQTSFLPLVISIDIHFKLCNINILDATPLLH